MVPSFTARGYLIQEGKKNTKNRWKKSTHTERERQKTRHGCQRPYTRTAETLPKNAPHTEHKRVRASTEGLHHGTVSIKFMETCSFSNPRYHHLKPNCRLEVPLWVHCPAAPGPNCSCCMLYTWMDKEARLLHRCDRCLPAVQAHQNLGKFCLAQSFEWRHHMASVHWCTDMLAVQSTWWETHQYSRIEYTHKLTSCQFPHSASAPPPSPRSRPSSDDQNRCNLPSPPSPWIRTRM